MLQLLGTEILQLLVKQERDMDGGTSAIASSDVSGAGSKSMDGRDIGTV